MKKHIFLSIFMVFLMIWLSAAHPVSGAISVGDSTKLDNTLSMKFTDAQGEKFDDSVDSKFHVELVDQRSADDYYMFYEKIETEAKLIQVHNGEWYQAKLADDFKETNYFSVIDHGTYQPSDFGFYGDAFVDSDGTTQPVSLTDNMAIFASDPSAFLTALSQALNDYTDQTSIDYSYSYTDFNGDSQTKSGTATMSDKSVSLDGNTLELKYTINSALDDSLFYRGPDNRPVTITFTYEGKIEYNDNGLLKSFDEKITIDAGDTGNIEMKYSTGGGFLGISGAPLDFTVIIGSLAIISMIAVIVRRRTFLNQQG